MKAISLWQPHASLWLSPAKIHETRHWRMNVPVQGFWCAVHAANRCLSYIEPALREILERQFGRHWAMELPRGALLGAVHIEACERSEAVAPNTTPDDLVCGNFDPGRHCFRRGPYKLLRQPIPYRGQQGWFTVDDKLLEDIGWQP